MCMCDNTNVNSFTKHKFCSQKKCIAGIFVVVLVIGYCCLLFDHLDWTLHINDIIVFGSLLYAIRTYNADVQHKKIQQTMDIIFAFLDGDWISDYHKQHWNNLIDSLNTCCTGIDFDEHFFCNAIGEQMEISEIFREDGFATEFGSSVKAIAQLLEYIARRASNENLDIDLIQIRLYSFYTMAYYFLKCGKIDDFPTISQLCTKLENAANKKVPFGEMYKFNIAK